MSCLHEYDLYAKAYDLQDDPIHCVATCLPRKRLSALCPWALCQLHLDAPGRLSFCYSPFSHRPRLKKPQANHSSSHRIASRSRRRVAHDPAQQTATHSNCHSPRLQLLDHSISHIPAPILLVFPSKFLSSPFAVRSGVLASRPRPLNRFFVPPGWVCATQPHRCVNLATAADSVVACKTSAAIRS